MNWFDGFLTGGNVLVKVLVLQIFIVCAVLFVLKSLLERELILLAIEKLSHRQAESDAALKEFNILVAGKLSNDFDFRLRTLIKEKCPSAEINIIVSKEIWGGIVLQMGNTVLDFSLANRLKHLFGQRE